MAKLSPQSHEKRRLLLTADRLQVNVGEKQILYEISAVARSSRLLAVMGPSGSGKTTFMNTISGRMALASGTIQLNKKPVSARMRKNFGYVTQMDVFFPMLTLRQTVQFAARVKLPDSVSEAERNERVAEVVKALQLEKCLDTIMGSFIMPGLSGGEKKRANVACELLRNPDVLLLDEPTSGLDASLALSLIDLLRAWATELGKIVVMSIHQPSSQIFHVFDDLLLLTEGHTSYFGKQSGMVSYFESIGVPFKKHWNPADFMLEVVKPSSDSKKLIIDKGSTFSNLALIQKATQPARLSAEKCSENSVEEDAGADVESAAADLDVGYVNPTFSDDSASNGDSVVEVEDADESGLSELAEVAVRQVSWRRQLAALTIRGFHVSRTRFLSIFPLIQTLFVGILSSLLWFQIARKEEQIKDILGCIFFLTINLSFAPLFEAIMSFHEDIMIVRHERRAGMYQIGAYYVSKMLTEMPLAIAVPFVTLTMVYWLSGLAGGAEYLPFVFGILINTLACQGIGIFIGLLTDSPKTNLTIAYVFMMFSMLMGGFFTTAVPVWLIWAKWVSFIRFCYHFCLLLVFQRSVHFTCATTLTSFYPACANATLSADNQTAVFPSTDIVERFSDEFIPVWANFLIMFFLFVLFRVLGYLWLRFMRKV